MYKRAGTFFLGKKHIILLSLSIAIVAVCVLIFGLQYSHVKEISAERAEAEANKKIEPYIQRDTVSTFRPSGELLRDYGTVAVVKARPKDRDIMPAGELAGSEMARGDDAAPVHEIVLKPAPIIVPPSAGVYRPVAVAPPNSNLKFDHWTAAEVPLSEIIEKRKKIAQGERLYKRVIVKRTDPFARPATVDDLVPDERLKNPPG